MIQFPGNPDYDPRILLVVQRDTYENAVRAIGEQAHEGDEYPPGLEWDGPNAGGINDGPHP